SLMNVGIGNYSLRVNDEQGCREDITTVMDYADSLIVMGQVYPASCFGEEEVSIQLDVQEGRGGYSYGWSNGADLDSISGLSPGTYTVTVTDLKTGCERQESFDVAEPMLLSLEVNVSDDSCAIQPIGAIQVLV